MSKCPRCAELIPAARLEEHLYFHEKYGTGARKQESLEKSVAAETEPVINKTLKEVSGKYRRQSQSGARKQAIQAVESEHAPSGQAEERRIEPEQAEFVRADLDKPVKTMIIDGKVYVDRTVKAPVPPEIAEILQRSKKRSAVAAPKTREQPPQELKSEPAPQPADPRLASLETFQDFLLYAAEKRLPKREFDMLCQRFGLLDGEGRTLAEVGQIHHLSRERIRQLINRSMRRIASLGTRQLNGKKWKAPCAMVVACVQDEIRHKEEGAAGRFMDFADAELPHLTLDRAVNLLGYFFGGQRGIKTYRRRLSQ